MPGISRVVPASEGPPVGRLRLTSFERNLWQVGIAELERSLAEVTSERVAAWFESDPGIREVALLRTCQRILLLAVSGSPGAEEPWTARLGVAGSWTVRSDTEAIRHLYRISAGLDSRAPGEREVQEQVRSTAGGVLSRHPRPVLRNLLLGAADAARRLDATEAGSVADLAVDWLRPRLPPYGARVLVIGAGTVGRTAAERLSSFAAITIIYRHHAPDPAWLERWNVRARPSGEMQVALESSDAVIAAAKTTGRLLGAEELAKGPGAGPRWFVDLGLPRNVDPEVGLRAGTQLVDLDGLPRGRVSAGRIAEMSRAVDAAAAEGLREFAVAAVEPWISELRGWAEAIRQEEWDRARTHAGTISEPARLAFERFSDRLVRRLLAGPTRELRELPPGPEMDSWRRRLVELFEATDRGP